MLRKVLILTFALALQFAFAGEPEPMDDFEPAPEGFEERRYLLAGLTTSRKSLDQGHPMMGGIVGNAMSEESIMSILRYAAAPDSWTRRGAARMSIEGGSTLVVLQKKEAHDEIAKVLNWLREAVATPSRTTVVMAALKPDALAKLQSGTGVIAPAELFKLLDEAGEGAVQIAELRGIEGQVICSTGNFRQHYMGDIDVSGAIFDPVIRSLITGFLARAKTQRLPDGQSARVDLRASWSGPAKMDNTEMRIRSSSVRSVRTTYRPRSADERKGEAADKKDEPIMERVPGPATPAEFASTIKIETPQRAEASLEATVIAPRGQFVLAGIFDLSPLGDGKTKDRRAILVRADVGNAGVPTLQGVSGLKEGELFKLYTLESVMNHLQDHPAPQWGEPDFSTSIDLGAGRFSGMGAANPFDTSSATVALRTVNTQKFQALFAERVRKNKIIETYGETMFARLNADDHAKLSANLMNPARQQFGGVRVRAVALAVPQAAFRKLLLEDALKLDDAAVEALAALPGTVALADTAVVVQPAQTTHVFGGQLASALTDLEVSGDTYDPSVSSIMEKGYVFESSLVAQNAAGLSEITALLRAYPGATKLEKVPFESFAVNSGSASEVLLSISTDTTRARMAVITLQGSVNLTKGNFALAGSVPMPPDADGKADPRQAILLLRADDAAQP